MDIGTCTLLIGSLNPPCVPARVQTSSPWPVHTTEPHFITSDTSLDHRELITPSHPATQYSTLKDCREQAINAWEETDTHNALLFLQRFHREPLDDGWRGDTRDGFQTLENHPGRK